MKLLKDIRTYIMEDEFKLIYQNNKINIINYISVIHFDNEKVMIELEKNNLCVTGKSLVVSKLLKDELLISGDIISIEFR